MTGRYPAPPPVAIPSEPGRGRGTAAEDAACRHLEGMGFSVVARNLRAGGGEIDIVARKRELLVFVEVRSREATDFGSPEQTVGPRKRLRVAAAARRYLSRVPAGSWQEARFDVIAIEGSGTDAVLRHYEAAFDAKGKVL